MASLPVTPGAVTSTPAPPSTSPRPGAHPPAWFDGRVFDGRVFHGRLFDGRVRGGLLTGVAVAGWLAVTALPAPAVVPGTLRPPWWVFAAVFAIAEVWSWHRPEETHLTSGPAGMVALGGGLLLVPPGWLVTASVVGGVVGCAAGAVLGRASNRPAGRPVVRVISGCLAAALACAVHTFVAGSGTALTPRGWAGALAGVVIGATISRTWTRSWPIRCPIPATGAAGTWLHASFRPWTCAMVITVLLAMPGVGAAVVLSVEPSLALPLAVCAACVLLGVHAFIAGSGARVGLMKVRRCSDVLRDATDLDAVARALVVHARTAVRADYAELIMIERDGGIRRWTAPSGRVAEDPFRQAPAGAVARDAEELLAVARGGMVGMVRTAPVAGPAPTAGAAVEVGATSPSPVLAVRGLRSGVVRELPVGGGVRAVLLIADQGTRLRTIRSRQARLVETMADLGTLALRQAHALERLRHDAGHDRLTGLPNRSEFRRKAVAAVTASLTGGGSCAIGVLDLDGFKTVNDSLGHLAGDAVLAEVGRRLSQVVAGERLSVCRMGGDEFAVLAVDVTEQHLLDIAGRLLACLREPFSVIGDQVRLTASLGLALSPRDGISTDQLLRHADIAMYVAKEEGLGAKVYSGELTSTAHAPLSLAADLRLALARGDLAIAVQPLVSLATGRLHSVEALARWRHPQLGPVNPEAFVQAAERGGLVGELTDVVIDRALKASRDWLLRGLEVQVAVNLAARTLSDPKFPATVHAALERYGVPGYLLCFELTETGVVASPDRVLEVLDRLRELGVRVAIDDFGTGYSSMTYMNWLSPDQVKIDKSFVQRLLIDPRSAAIVRSIIDLGANLGVEVVAEGVGDVSTASVLADLGCAIGQGYLFAEPMQTKDLPDWIARWASERELEDPLNQGDVSLPAVRSAGVPSPEGHWGAVRPPDAPPAPGLYQRDHQPPDHQPPDHQPPDHQPPDSQSSDAGPPNPGRLESTGGDTDPSEAPPAALDDDAPDTVRLRIVR